MIKYRLIFEDGSWQETLDLQQATLHGTYTVIEEDEQPLQLDVPTEVALWKLRFILSQMELETTVGDVINQLPEPQKTAAKYLWDRGTAVDRYSPTVDLIKQSIGLTDSDVDNIFREANLIIL